MRAATAIVLLAVLGVATAASLSEQFADYKARFGKTYASAAEEAKRFAIFEENMKVAAKQNAANPHATFGVNEYADMSATEFKVRHNAEKYYKQMAAERKGAIPDLYTAEELKARTVEKVDWRAKGAVTYIRNQGQCGSCWSFGTVAGIEGQWFLAGNKLVALSEQEFVSCDTIDDGCQGGLPQYAMKWDLENRGGKLVTAASYPYVSGNGEVPACDMKGTVVAAQISGYKDLPHNEAQMAAWCAANGPITIGVDASSFQTYVGGILTNCISQQVDHCVAIVGFDLTNSPPYWIIKNSWGTSWGEQGYIRVEYGTDQCMITSGPITSEVKKAGPTPPPGPPTPVPPPPPPTPAPAQPEFVVNGAGPGFNAPTGYALASLGDLNTEAFRSTVNGGNLLDGGESVAGCCCLAIAEGYLVYKDTPDTYLGAYTSQGTYDCSEVLTNPVYIGSSVNGGLPYPDWLNPLTKDITSQFTSAANFDPLIASGCAAGQPTWGIYKKKGGPTPPPTPAPAPTPSPPTPLFAVNGAGPGFNPPSGYELASIAQLQGKEFISQTNGGNLLDAGETVAGCCVFAVKEGFLTYNSDPVTYLGPYDNTGNFDCQEVLTNPIYLGSVVGGGLPNPDFLNPLDAKTVAHFTFATSFEPLYQYGCTAGQPTWGIYIKKEVPTPAPTKNAGNFTQKVCSNDKCTSDCVTTSYPLERCIRTAEGYSMQATCTSSGLKVDAYLASEDCAGASMTFTNPLDTCLEDPSGSYIEDSCKPSQHAAQGAAYRVSKRARKAL